MERLRDISEVCDMLGTTSRTLRFYEEKGLIGSTVVPPSARRKYTKAQIDGIRDVMAFRALGLSVATIRQMRESGGDLRELLCLKRAEIYASIEAKIREIDLLNEVLSAIDSGTEKLTDILPDGRDVVQDELVRECTEAIIGGDTASLYAHMGERMKEYLPCEVYENVRRDTFLPLGSFAGMGKTEADAEFPHRVYQYVRFSKLGLKITFVIYGGRIEGLWLGYYDMKEGTER